MCRIQRVLWIRHFVFKLGKGMAMRFFRFVCMFVCCGVLMMPAYGFDGCVALSTSSSCSFGSGRGLDWSGSCTTMGVSTSLRGVGVCAATSGSMGDTSGGLSLSSRLDDNVYCWCKLVVPAVSNWVTVGLDGRSYSECAMNCAAACASNLRTVSSMRNALLGNIISD